MKLSLCIPVYNCADFLGAALDSILPQATKDVEVIVYDGGSTDETSELIESYLAGRENLSYYRGSSRGGIDADLETCVGYARGEYCWLFSGDDVMRPYGIASALKWIDSGLDLYVCAHTLCDKRMVIARDYPVLHPNVSYSANLADQGARREWFARAANTEAFFSFMSGLIVRRSRWIEGRLIPEFNGSCWAHVARFFELIPSGLSVVYVADVWLDRRGENDSFRENGIVRRYALAIEGFQQLSDKYFTRSSVEAKSIRRVIRREFPLSVFLMGKLLCAEHPTVEERALLDRLFAIAYPERTLLQSMRRLAYRHTPLIAMRVARAIRNHFRVPRPSN